MKSIIAPNILVFVFLLMACSPKILPSNTGKITEYDEDLSAYRPKFKPVVVSSKAVYLPEKKVELSSKPSANEKLLHINRRLDMVLDTLAIRNRTIKMAQGFRIQIFVGNSKIDADAAKLYIYQTFTELMPYLQFTQPTFRLKVGDFLTRLDAERYLVKLKEIYPSALIMPEKVELKKSLLIR